MAADGKSFGISLGINFAILTGCLLFFGAGMLKKVCGMAG
jgi:hypothetical protein